MEWGDSDAREIENGEKVQLRSFSTSNHRVDTLVSYRYVVMVLTVSCFGAFRFLFVLIKTDDGMQAGGLRCAANCSTMDDTFMADKLFWTTFMCHLVVV